VKKITILIGRASAHVWQKVSFHTKMLFVWGASYKNVPFVSAHNAPNASNILESLGFRWRHGVCYNPLILQQNNPCGRFA
jgi:hypothetical protein